jgi:hypothetical protein
MHALWMCWFYTSVLNPRFGQKPHVTPVTKAPPLYKGLKFIAKLEAVGCHLVKEY